MKKDWNLSKIIDYGSCEVGIESTVVDCRGDIPIILRHGYVTSEMISDIFNSDILGTQEFDELISPGQMKSHYSPKANVYINQKSSVSDSAWLTFGNIPKTLQKEKIMFNLSPSGNLFQACNKFPLGLKLNIICSFCNVFGTFPKASKALSSILNFWLI